MVQLYIISEMATKVTFMLGSGVQFKVSSQDKMFVIGQSWSFNGRYIQCASGKFIRQYLHVLIAQQMSLDISSQIDHRDLDSLNNCRDNLRIATSSQNHMNSLPRNDSGFKGIQKMKSGRYLAYGTKNGIRSYLGSRSSLEEAYKLRRDWEIENFGEFSRINNISKR